MTWDSGNPWNPPARTVYVETGYSIEKTDALIGRLDGQIDKFRAENIQLKKTLGEAMVANKDFHERYYGQLVKNGELKNKLFLLEEANNAEKKRSEAAVASSDNWRMQCHVNYGEKKALYEYARKLRIFSENATPIEPMLYMGLEGNVIREKMRDAGKKVYEAGGDLNAVARSVKAEMCRNIQFEAPSVERLAVVNAVKRDILRANPPEDDGKQYTEDEQMQRCAKLFPV